VGGRRSRRPVEEGCAATPLLSWEFTGAVSLTLSDPAASLPGHLSLRERKGQAASLDS
jgi:hypothetical protein